MSGSAAIRRLKRKKRAEKLRLEDDGLNLNERNSLEGSDAGFGESIDRISKKIEFDMEIEPYFYPEPIPIIPGFENVYIRFHHLSADIANDQRAADGSLAHFDNRMGPEGSAADSSWDEQTDGDDSDQMMDEERTEHGDGDENAMGVSKKKSRKVGRMTLAALKQYARRPELVEWEDVTATDPRLLIRLKEAAHTVPVPRHWSAKRKYLAGKRGFVKAPFKLPPFLAETGVGEERTALAAEEAQKSAKVKQRERRLGKIVGRGGGVDYQRLYDAFFKYQTRPPLTPHGDLYWEGRDFGSVKGPAMGGGGLAGALSLNAIPGGSQMRPGRMSELLQQALGMESAANVISSLNSSPSASVTVTVAHHNVPVGTVHNLSTPVPPPWLHAMQKAGQGPPSYPHLLIPGFNAPIPHGAQWGFHPTGWGRPPAETAMQLLMGEKGGGDGKPAISTTMMASGISHPLGAFKEDGLIRALLNAEDRRLWGELEPEEDSDDEEVEEEDLSDEKGLPAEKIKNTNSANNNYRSTDKRSLLSPSNHVDVQVKGSSNGIRTIAEEDLESFVDRMEVQNRPGVHYAASKSGSNSKSFTFSDRVVESLHTQITSKIGENEDDLTKAVGLPSELIGRKGNMTHSSKKEGNNSYNRR